MAGLAFSLLAPVFGNILGGIFGSKAANTAASQQVEAGNNALAFQKDAFGQSLDFQKQVYGDQQKNQQPFLEAGQQSIGQLMAALKDGTFGPGSNPTFEAPTAEQARNTPGYQFTSQQGTAGILKGAAAAGGAISGGTLKSLGRFNAGLADSTYNDVFNRSMSTYQAGLQKQGQEFGQLLAPAQIGEGAVQSLNNSGSQAAQNVGNLNTSLASNVGNLMTQIGNSKASGTVGSSNAWSSAFGGAGNDISQALLLQKLFSKPAGTGPG